jgi:hypothetical protein
MAKHNPTEDIRTIADAFNALMHQLELGDHQDSMGHRVLMNGELRALRDRIAGAGGDVVEIEAARERASAIAERDGGKL